MKAWFYKLYILLITELAKQIAIHVCEIENQKNVFAQKLVEEQRKASELDTWCKNNPNTIRHARATAVFKGEEPPEPIQIYEHFKNMKTEEDAAEVKRRILETEKEWFNRSNPRKSQ
jgi:hypothetical protein